LWGDQGHGVEDAVGRRASLSRLAGISSIRSGKRSVRHVIGVLVAMIRRLLDLDAEEGVEPALEPGSGEEEKSKDLCARHGKCQVASPMKSVV